jgi:alkylation response protein AidB-like acyl-CoA dehydrogenase
MSFVSADKRDQQFVLYEMLNIEELCHSARYRGQDRQIYDMALDLAASVATQASWPTFAEADEQGVVFKDGQVTVPACFKKLHEVMNSSGLPLISVNPEQGGQGMPFVLDVATREHYIFNMSYNLYAEAGIGVGNLIAQYGSETQKQLYLNNIYEGRWGGTMVLTEPEAGSDVGAIRAKAVRQPDGSYRLFGQKCFISGGDSDLYENIVHAVLARIEGDPAGTEGLSLFLVPKWVRDASGGFTLRNDYSIGSVEKKMGVHGSATCGMDFGDNGQCYAELLGEPRQGMKIMFHLMNEARLTMGVQGVGTASLAYLLGLQYAKERVQGSHPLMRGADAPKIPIIQHPDVRRMLLWMKSHVEGMRAMVYFAAWTRDIAVDLSGDQQKKWRGIYEMLIPVIKSYCTDVGFRVTEMAIQVHGGYGYTKDYAVEQLMRDLKVASIYEGTNGIQAIDLIGRKLLMGRGEIFTSMIFQMKEMVDRYRGHPHMELFRQQTMRCVDELEKTGSYILRCWSENKGLTPLVKAYPFMNMFATALMGCLHFWAYGASHEKMVVILKENQLSYDDREEIATLAGKNSEVAFYHGKMMAATYFIRNVLPDVLAMGGNIRNGDLSAVDILEEGF